MIKKTILVVEDEKPLLQVIKSTLEKNGFEVITARSAKQAKKYILDVGKIDAIWLDHYLLGKESGLDFVLWCKKETKEHENLPIFLVSNTAGSEKVQTYLTLGVNKYYIKAEKKLGDIIKDIQKFLEEETG